MVVTKRFKTLVPSLVLLLGMAGGLSVYAGSAIVGSVAGSMNATIGGQALLPNTTIFSGDSLTVKDGAAVVAVGRGGRLVFGRETVASFLRETGEVTVLRGQGNVSLYTAGGAGLRVKVGEVSILPAAGYKTLGEVALLNGAVVVTAKEGKLRVEGNGPAVEVVKEKTITVLARSPQGGAAAGAGSAQMGTSTLLQLSSVAAGTTSAILSGAAMRRADEASQAAVNANNRAGDVIIASQEAEVAAQQAQQAAHLVGCAVNEVSGGIGTVSPYTLPPGLPCP
jgi:hypothetical protein